MPAAKDTDKNNTYRSNGLTFPPLSHKMFDWENCKDLHM